MTDTATFRYGLSSDGIKAFINFQKEVGPVVRDSVNGHFHNNYVALDGLIETTYPTLNANGFMVSQTTHMTDDFSGMYLETSLVYEDGSYVTGTYALNPKEATNPQQLGSCLTYARRYALFAILGLAPEDDDGNESSGISTGTKSKPAAKTSSKPAAKSDGKPAFAASKTKPPSPAQQSFINNLLKEKLDFEPNSAEAKAYLEEYMLGGESILNMKSFDAAEIITLLKEDKYPVPD